MARFNPQEENVYELFDSDGLPGPTLRVGARVSKIRAEKCFSVGLAGDGFLPDKFKVHRTLRYYADRLRLFGTSRDRRALPPWSSQSHQDLSFHDQNVFSPRLRRSAQSGNQPLRYRLKGWTRWNDADSDRRQATFTTLPSGMYTFQAGRPAAAMERPR